MMLRENERAFEVKLPANDVLDPDFLFHPDRDRFQKRAQTKRRASYVGGKKPIAFQKWLFVEGDEIQFLALGNSAFAQTVINRVPRKSGIVFLSGETFFLRRRDDDSIADETRGAVVIKRGKAEDVHGSRARNLA